MRKYPPKKINHWYGYRTPASQKSQERWDFAQIYSANEFIKAGIVILLLGFPGTFMLPNSPTGAFAAIFLMLIASLISIYRVERAIKKKFGK
ncbi:SdpI family protein [Robiginitalea sp. IMCC43444]|uniref:SdpI family protein n=1 Tax=Robiginitalea sp. IMCC43444 TaxID=3459121 RepID=UPI0040411D12